MKTTTLRAGTVKVPFRLLCELLGLGSDHQILGIFRDPTTRSTEAALIVVGPLMPEIGTNEEAPYVKLTFKRSDGAPVVTTVELDAETKAKVATDEAVKAAVDDCGKRVGALTGESVVDTAKRWLKNFEGMANLRRDRFVINQEVARRMLEWIVAHDDRDKTAPPRDLPTEASVLVDHEQRLKRLEDLLCCYPTETSK